MDPGPSSPALRPLRRGAGIPLFSLIPRHTEPRRLR